MTYLGVKLKINESLMSEFQMRRLNQILYRDSRIIREYLNICKENETSLCIKKKNGGIIERIDAGNLDKITATTDTRAVVKHDLKSRYPRISLNELKECRDTAVEMYNSYLSLKDNGGNFPTVNRLVPRSIGYRRFTFEIDNMTLSIMDSMDTNPKMIRENKSRTEHDQLDIPIELNNYHLDNFNKGEIKAVKIIYQNNQLWVACSVKKEVEQLKKMEKTDKPIGVLGIDLGINIAAFSAFLTSKGVSCQKSFRVSREIQDSYVRLENRVSDLQRTKEIRLFDNIIRVLDDQIFNLKHNTSYDSANHVNDLLVLNNHINHISINNIHQITIINKKIIKNFHCVIGQLKSKKKALENKKNKSKQVKREIKVLQTDLKNIYRIMYSLYLIEKLENNWDKHTDGIFNKLKELRNDRHNLKVEIDRKIVNQITLYVAELSKEYNVYVAIGKLTGIRNIARRGNRNKAHRKRMHRWSFSRITLMLQNKMSGLGLEKRFFAVDEKYTSKKCWKCNVKGTRPMQSLFICSNPACNWSGNADLNGAVNIAKRLIRNFKLTKTSLFGKKGLGKYLPVTSKRKNGKVRNVPKARMRSPRRKTTGIKPLDEWFRDDLSEGLETPLVIVGQTNRTKVQHSKLPDKGKSATTG